MTDSKYSNRSFLTEEQKKEIMHLYIDEGMTYTEIGYKYGMSKTPIFNFIRRQNITEAQNEKHWAAYVKTHPGTILTAGRKRANASPRKRPKPCAYFEAPSPHRNIITEKQI